MSKNLRNFKNLQKSPEISGHVWKFDGKRNDDGDQLGAHAGFGSQSWYDAHVDNHHRHHHHPCGHQHNRRHFHAQARPAGTAPGRQSRAQHPPAAAAYDVYATGPATSWSNTASRTTSKTTIIASPTRTTRKDNRRL